VKDAERRSSQKAREAQKPPCKVIDHGC
jgi:hypothetical protein